MGGFLQACDLSCFCMNFMLFEKKIHAKACFLDFVNHRPDTGFNGFTQESDGLRRSLTGKKQRFEIVDAEKIGAVNFKILNLRAFLNFKLKSARKFKILMFTATIFSTSTISTLQFLPAKLLRSLARTKNSPKGNTLVYAFNNLKIIKICADGASSGFQKLYQKNFVRQNEKFA